MIKATVITDSISQQGKRLLTYSLEYPRFIHAEFMTHRMISRNASSSRALPPGKLAEEAAGEHRAVPVLWGGERRGMQVGAELEGVHLKDAQYQWACAAAEAVKWAKAMSETGVHKSISNRILEPFTHIRVVATATEWDNFFGLRLDAQAEPTMRALAVAMWEARCASTPQLLTPGQWHLPYIDDSDLETLVGHILEPVGKSKEYIEGELTKLAIKVSVARCARVSYFSFDTKLRSSIGEDLKLYDRLLGAQSLHASPAEHSATPDTMIDGKWDHPEEHANFRGWRMYRKMLAGEACAPLPKEYVK